MPIPEPGFDGEKAATPLPVAAPVAVAERPTNKGGRPPKAVAEMPEPNPNAAADAPPVVPPTAPLTMEDLAREIARLQVENSQFKAIAVEALTRQANKPTDEPPAAPQPVRKLLFIGQRLVTQNGRTWVEADVMASNDGPLHVCGRGGMPVVFKGSLDDPRVHAMVPQNFGDWLIRHDGPADQWGNVTPRYQWSDD